VIVGDSAVDASLTGDVVPEPPVVGDSAVDASLTGDVVPEPPVVPVPVVPDVLVPLVLFVEPDELLIEPDDSGSTTAPSVVWLKGDVGAYGRQLADDQAAGPKPSQPKPSQPESASAALAHAVTSAHAITSARIALRTHRPPVLVPDIVPASLPLFDDKILPCSWTRPA